MPFQIGLVIICSSGERHRTGHRQRSWSRLPLASDRCHSSPWQHKPSSYHHDRSHYSSDNRRHDEVTVSKRLTQEELEQKRREMMSNAEWHAEKRES